MAQRSLVWIVLVLTLSWVAQGFCSEGGGASPFLRAGLGARALAMGNAGTSGQCDATDVYWNPAALASGSNVQVAAQTVILGTGRSQQALVFSYLPVDTATPPLLVLAGGWYHYSAGEDLEYRLENRPTASRNFGDQENVFLIGSAATLAPGWEAGVMLKYYTHTLDSVNGNGLGLDCGLRTQILPGSTLGVVLQDFLGYKKWSDSFSEPLPWVMRVGAQHHLGFWQTVLVLDAGVPWRNDLGQFQTPTYHAGIEISPWLGWPWRAGIDNGDFTAGTGVAIDLNWAELFCDYAFSTQPELTGAFKHLLSLHFSMALAPAAKAENPSAEALHAL